jgi:hypothetical protein
VERLETMGGVSVPVRQSHPVAALAVQVTYKNMDKWFEELQEYCPGIPCICVGNKIDSARPFRPPSARDGTKRASSHAQW